MSALAANRPVAGEASDAWPAALATKTSAAPVSLVPTVSDHAHFVFKKGHLGRYRFNLMLDDGRVGGDVRVATAGVGRLEKERAALLQMRRVAEALLVSLDVAVAHLDQAASDGKPGERA